MKPMPLWFAIPAWFILAVVYSAVLPHTKSIPDAPTSTVFDGVLP